MVYNSARSSGFDVTGGTWVGAGSDGPIAYDSIHHQVVLYRVS
jgi:hypothetical protein